MSGEFYNLLLQNRDSIDVEMDGVVIKVDDIEKGESLGYTQKFPKYICAYKFPAVENGEQSFRNYPSSLVELE